MRTAGPTTKVETVKLSYREVKRAAQMESEEGIKLWALAVLFNVHENTMSKYLRNYRKYGRSYWSNYPEEVNDGRPSW